MRAVNPIRGFLLCTWVIVAPISRTEAAPTVPSGFAVEVAANLPGVPTATAIARDGRIFAADWKGIVLVVQNGEVSPEPFIDLECEVGTDGHRGLLGIALDPNFPESPWVYLLYVVDPIECRPDESSTMPTFGRLVRYQADPANGHNTAILESRETLIGAIPSQGFIHCWTSHSVGALRFANDGTLFVGVGDGAHFDSVIDPGGRDPSGFIPPLFDPIHDIGAFRAQHLGSLAGKILRIDPETGLGLPDNPYWTGNGADTASKVWVYGVRNPFRFGLKPNSGSPETIYMGDVGWSRWEEVNVAHGGENFGWPCFEGYVTSPAYQAANPAHSGCGTLGTASNPGPVKTPILIWHHTSPNLSVPPGYTGDVAIGGEFYSGRCYPPEYRGRFFYADYFDGWIRMLQTDVNDNMVGISLFATAADRPTDFMTDPGNGDLYYLSRLGGLGVKVYRITYPNPPADADRDCDVDLHDFGMFQRCFGGSAGPIGVECQMFDTDSDGDVDASDYEDFRRLFTGAL